ncbi:MAG TPA: GspH/FimT family pseudopilin [Blastocatellia bacterium]|nr:GspH/FimT family pseudopilin [Blastocatellia bacterium]
MFRKKNLLEIGERKERGFSLIEMAVVLLIIAVVAAFVVPQVVAYMRMYRVGVAARNVATALQRARFLATSNNTRAGIMIPELQRVDIQQYDPEGKGEPQIKGAIKLPEGVTIDSEAPRQLAFDGRGVVTPLPTEKASIRVNGAEGYFAIVVISPTGQITISEAKEDSES